MNANRGRLGSYRPALEKVVKPGSVVVDIGTGIGLLAMFYNVHQKKSVPAAMLVLIRLGRLKRRSPVVAADRD